MTPGLTAMASPLTGKDRPMSPFVDYLFSSPIGFPSLSSPFGGRHGHDVFALKDGALCLESLYGDAAEGAEHQEDGGLFASYDVLKGNGYPLVESPVADPGSRGTPLYKGRGRKRCYSAMAPLSESALAPLPPVPGDFASPSGLRLRSSDGVCGGLESSEHGADGDRSVAAPKDGDVRVFRRVGAPEADAEAEIEAEAELDLEASVRCQRDEVARLEEAVHASEAELAAVNAERRDVWAAVAAIRTCVLAGAAALGLERGAAAAGARARGGLGGAGLPPLRLVEMHQGHVGAPTVGGSVTAGLHPSIVSGPHLGAGGGSGSGPSHHHAASSLLSAGNGAGSSVGSPCLGVGLDAAGFASLVAGGPPPPPAATLSEDRSRAAAAPLGGRADRSPRPRPPPLSLATIHAAGEDPLAHAHAAPLAIAGGADGGDDGLRTPRGGASRGPGSAAFERAMQGGGYRPSHQQHQQALEQHRLRQHAGPPSTHGASLPPPPPHHLHSQPIPSSRLTPGGSPAPAPVLESSSSGLLGTPTAASLGTPSSARDARHVGSLDDALAFDPASAALLGSIFSPVPDATVSAIGRHAAGLDMLESPIKHLDSPLIPAKGHRRLFADETAAARSIAAARAAKMPLGAPTVQPHGLSFVTDGFFEDLG